MEQDEAPRAELYLPGAQNSHLLARSCAEYCPASHSVQPESPMLL